MLLPSLRLRTAAVTPAVAFAVVAATSRHRPVFRTLTGEDALLEWVQFGAYASAAIAFALVARRVPGRADRVLAGLAAAGFGAVSGEEVAWGQRLFDLHAGAIQSANAQGELTLHNLGNGLAFSHAAFALLAAAAIAAPWLGRPLAPRLVLARLVVPPRWAVSWLAAGVAYVLVRLTFLPHPSYVVAKLSEVPETTVSVAFAVIAWRVWQAVQPVRS